MATDTTGNAGPIAEQYAGDGAVQIAKRLFNATRPKFYPASVLPVVAGSAWGYMIAGQFDLPAFVLALVATICVHAGANVLNDVGDDEGGTDRQNQDRIYPYTGGSRFIQSGILSRANMKRLGISLLGVASVAGAILVVTQGPLVLGFGLAGMALAVLYSLGPMRLSATGLGELSVGIAFGVIPVVGSAWLQSGVIDLPAVLFSVSIAAWVTAILLVNEVPDIRADGATGKRTLPVRIGLDGTALLYILLHAGAVGVVVWLTMGKHLPMLSPAVPVLLLVLAGKAAVSIRTGVADRQKMKSGIEATLGIHTIGTIWMTGCALFVAYWGA